MSNFKPYCILLISFLIGNNSFSQDASLWKELNAVFSKILTTEDFRLTKKQKEAMISSSNYNLEMPDTFFKIERWDYQFDDFFQTDYLIFTIKRFEEYWEGESDNYGLAQMEKIIDQILTKDYIKFKDTEVIERENRTDDNVLELIKDFELSESKVIQWMHTSDVGGDYFVPLKKSVRIFYDGWFDELTITFNGVDRLED